MKLVALTKMEFLEEKRLGAARNCGRAATFAGRGLDSLGHLGSRSGYRATEIGPGSSVCAEPRGATDSLCSPLTIGRSAASIASFE